MNDLENICRIVQPTFYADDTNLRITSSKSDFNELKVNVELNTIERWFVDAKSVLNASKSKIVSTQKATFLSMQGIGIDDSISLKYLGVIIDKNLSINFHIEMLSENLGKHIAMVSRLRHFVTRKVLVES